MKKIILLMVMSFALSFNNASAISITIDDTPDHWTDSFYQCESMNLSPDWIIFHCLSQSRIYRFELTTPFLSSSFQTCINCWNMINLFF